MKRCVLPMLALATGLAGQTNPAALAAREWRQQHERAIVDEFVDLLSIPNIASDRANIDRNAQKVAAMLEKRGDARKARRGVEDRVR